jgi:hypothetical protein
MDVTMSKNTRTEVMEKLRRRYERAGPGYRRRLIDQVVDLLDCHRKSAIRALHWRARPKSAAPGVIGRPRIYDAQRLLPTLKILWLAGQQPCGKRLAGMMADWLPAYESYHRSLQPEVREPLLAASPATLDRLLMPLRAQYKRTKAGTKPGTLLRAQIPIRGGSWQEDEPGWLEADTVALCGGSVAGEFVWMLDGTDLCTTWVEMRALWGRGQHGAVSQLADIEQSLPFAWLGLDNDNGGEFLNHHVLKWCQKGRRRPIYCTRSRPYRSNDNAHVEQKNWTHVRHWFGYERHDNAEVVGLINELAKGPLGQFVNLFSPSMKLERKEKADGGRERRVYGKPLTPYARVMASGQVTQQKKKELKALKESLNPFELEAQIRQRLGMIDRVRRCRS